MKIFNTVFLFQFLQSSTVTQHYLKNKQRKIKKIQSKIENFPKDKKRYLKLEEIYQEQKESLNL